MSNSTLCSGDARQIGAAVFVGEQLVAEKNPTGSACPVVEADPIPAIGAAVGHSLSLSRACREHHAGAADQGCCHQGPRQQAPGAEERGGGWPGWGGLMDWHDGERRRGLT